MTGYESNRPSREQLLNKINEVSFAVQDMQLYLNLHCQDKEALAYFLKMKKERKKALSEYSSYYGPLTIDTTDSDSSTCWKWSEQPFPWE